MYQIREGIVSRNIGGLYFLVDIHDKRCYEIKRLYSVNLTGKVLFDIMLSLDKFDVAGVADQFIPKLNGCPGSMKPKIEKDISSYFEELERIGYIQEVGQ